MLPLRLRQYDRDNETAPCDRQYDQLRLREDTAAERLGGEAFRDADGREVDVRQSNLQSGWTKSCGCQRDPGRNLHYKDGTCLELLRPDLMYRTNTSGVKGVYYSKTRGKWIAQIMFRNKCFYLGGFDTIEDAAQARREAEKQFFGKHIQ